MVLNGTETTKTRGVEILSTNLNARGLWFEKKTAATAGVGIMFYAFYKNTHNASECIPHHDKTNGLFDGLEKSDYLRS